MENTKKESDERKWRKEDVEKDKTETTVMRT